VGVVLLALIANSAQTSASGSGDARDGKRLFERETFGGNGRTCRTCHSAETGTVSPQNAARRLGNDPHDPLFVHDGSDDGLGNGVTRMLREATILMRIPLPANVRLADDPGATFVILRRGIPTTLNTPALDPVLMVDGRQPNLESQAAGAISDHAQGVVPSAAELHNIAEFQRTSAFFSSLALQRFALGGAAPRLPKGETASEKRGRRLFEDLPPDPNDALKGICAQCHSGPLLNKTNEFAPLFIGLPIPTGTRFQSVGVSELNAAANPVRDFIFNPGPDQVVLQSPDPGRALITGIVDDPMFMNVNAFKISPLRGIRRTAPYFHDNSSKTLEDVAAHYATFFEFVTGGSLILTRQDQRDMVAFMKLLD
jgi:cytochrome c peroxidase